MKMPDIMLDLPVEALAEIEEYKARERTDDDLKAALRATRRQHGGLSLEEVARAIRSMFDTDEVGALIKSLQTHEE